MDYTKFLGRKSEVVLAYLGGPFAFGEDRRLRVAAPRPSSGFHRFELEGRVLRALGPADPPDLEGLPLVRGHHVRGWMARPSAGGQRAYADAFERVHLMPEEEPPPLARIRARRWHSRDAVFESLDFDGEVEELARLRLEKLEPLGELEGVTPALRLGYGVALTLAVAGRTEIALSVREAAAASLRVAEGGEAVARAFLAELAERRAEATLRANVRAIALGQEPRRRVTVSTLLRREHPTLDNAHLRAEVALDAAGARMLSSRNLGGGTLEVAFELMGERVVSVVDAITLQVHDSGVCLAGADDLVTLESLPGVIREAIETDALVITRR